jgi:hypothetical protein
MRRLIIPAMLAAALLSPLPAAAGSAFREGEARMAAAYADYRHALFATGQGNAQASREAVAGFRHRWTGLVATWRIVAPPQYADDERLTATLEAIAIRAEEAEKAIVRADLETAHELLEGIRDEIADLRLRNGTQTFSDRLNAYHAQMEKVLAVNPASLAGAELAAFRDEVAILDYLSRDVSRRFPPKAGALVSALRHATQELHAAVAAADPARTALALKAIKPAYARLFVPFG